MFGMTKLEASWRSKVAEEQREREWSSDWVSLLKSMCVRDSSLSCGPGWEVLFVSTVTIF